MQTHDIPEETIAQQLREALSQLWQARRPEHNEIELLVVGCSTSEIAGVHLGKAPNPGYGRAVAQTIVEYARQMGIAPAFQCCEHLNRALVMEREAARANALRIVRAVPHERAGGSCATAAYLLMRDPVLVESVAAHAGLDIGGTMIGMHLAPVAVPLRAARTHIGHAPLSMALTRPPLIGGERARYSL